MAAWRVHRPGPMRSGPLAFDRVPVPVAGDDEVLVKVRACGVCRTDLHVAEGDLPVHRQQVVPGHEVVGEVVARRRRGRRAFARGRPASASPGCGTPAANACTAAAAPRTSVLTPRYTGWDADGGYAEFAVAPAAYVHRLPGRLPGRADRPAAVRGDHRLPGTARARTCPRAGGSGSTASAAAPTSPRRWRWRGAPRCT